MIRRLNDKMKKNSEHRIRKKGLLFSILSTIICLSVMLLAVPAVSAEAEPATETSEATNADIPATATDITETTSLTFDYYSVKPTMSDNNTQTSFVFVPNNIIYIENKETPISSLYIVSDRPMGEFELTYNNKTQVYGQNGFIHNYIKLDEPTDYIELRISGGQNVTICDISAFSEGTTPPDWVQTWAEPLEKADMLLLPTHGDDEFIFFGGTIPYYAGQLGLDVQVAFLTNHWGEQYRTHELLDALWNAGLRNYPVICDYADLYCEGLQAAQYTYDSEAWTATQVELIRRFQPQVIIGHDINGEYGHGAHMLNTDTLIKALELSGSAENYPDSAEKYGTWDVPKTYLHLYAENPVTMNWDVQLDKFGNKTAYEVALESFNIYNSQTANYTVHKEGGGVYDCHAFGLYRTTVGADTGKNDFMENITPYRQTANPEQPDQNTDSSTDLESSSSSLYNDNSNVVPYVEPEETVGSTTTRVIFWICMGICLGAVIFIWIMLGKAKKQKKLEEQKKQAKKNKKKSANKKK